MDSQDNAFPRQLDNSTLGLAKQPANSISQGCVPLQKNCPPNIANIGVERLSFSLTWDLIPAGEVLALWADRSIIKFCIFHCCQRDALVGVQTLSSPFLRM